MYRRFREFALLDASLRQREMVSHPWPTLPTEKTWFPIGIMEPEFIEKRRVALEQYLQALIDVPDLHRTCAHYVAFLTQDKRAWANSNSLRVLDSRDAIADRDRHDQQHVRE